MGIVTLANPVAEASRLLAAIGATAPLRALGGVAVRMRMPDTAHPALLREPKDIDLFVPPKAARTICPAFASQGYREDKEFNALHGARRLLFYDDAQQRQVDVFVGAFEMCHTIPLIPRGLTEPLTLPLAELLMMKLQIVEINQKDELDAMALLAYHPIGDGDGDMVNGRHIADLCSDDWGLWRTTTQNLQRVHTAVRRIGNEELEDTVKGRAGELQARLATVQKSRRWRLRNRIGDRLRWYQEPDEVS
jgi:hypothetical protein